MNTASLTTHSRLTLADIAATAQQVEIIEAIEPHFVVRAAAGSGKTYVLVQRYLRHLLVEKCDPRSVLAFTFTAKVAAEMRQRVVSELRDRGEPDLAQAAETGPISTIHSFCERMLRENALEAGLDPDFDIANETEAEEFKRSAVREVITSTDGVASDEVQSLIGELTGRITYGSTGPYDMLEQAVLDVLSNFRGAGLMPSDLEQHHLETTSLVKHWHQLMMDSLPEETAKLLGPHIGGPGFYRIANEATQGRGARPDWLKQGIPTAEAHAARNAVALAHLATEAWLRMEAAMYARQVLDFSALERGAVRLLRTSEPTLDRVRKTYQYLLVDEAQDLNPTQHRLIDSINPKNLMLVGDSQQSIYGFRQADLATFEKRVGEMRAWQLSKNHRSTDQVLRFVDTVATTLWSSNYVPMLPAVIFDLDQPATPAEDDFAGIELWISSKQTADRMAARWVKDVVDEGENPGDIGVLVKNWRFGARMVAELRSLGVSARLTGGSSRFYTRLEIRDLANVMRVLGDPSDEFSLLAVLHSPLAGLTLDSIAMLASAGDIAASLKGFVPPVSEDGPKLQAFLEWFEPLSERSGRMAAWEVLSELFAVSGYIETLAARPRSHEAVANVRKLLLLASERPDLGPAEFAERIADIESLRHQESEASVVEDDDKAVKVLTIHSAKGLEFPVVVLPQTHDVNIRKTRNIEIDTRLQAFSPYLQGEPAPFHVFLGRRRQEREREDSARLLYVAMTRARRRLAVVTHAQAGNDTFAGVIARSVGLSSRGKPVGFRIREEEGKETGNLP